MLDWRDYAGQIVLVGQLWSWYQAHGFDLQRCYILGTLATGQDLSPAVKALLEDLDTEAPQADEVLWALAIDASGQPMRRYPLIVYDTHERLRYGAEFLQAVVQTEITTDALVLRHVQLADPEQIP